jgi:O-antigen/teichoic acid export membrane protein
MKRSLWSRLFDERMLQNPLAQTLLSMVQDSLVYLVGAALLGLGNFVLVPLYTRRLAPPEFAVFSLVDINILILVTVTQLGLGVSYLKWFSETPDSQRGTLLGSALVLGASTAFVSGGLLSLALASPLGEQWLRTSDRGFAWMVLPIVVLENLQGLFLSDLRARRRAAMFSGTTAVRLLAIVGASLWLVVLRGQGIAGILGGRLIGDAVGVAMSAGVCLRGTKLRLALPTGFSMIRYGLPLVWCALISMLLDASGRYFLTHFSTLEQVGLYGVAIKIANIFQMMVARPFGVAWGGMMFQIAKWPHARTIYSKLLAYVWVLALCGALILALFTPVLFALFATPAYAAATAIFPLLLLVRAVNLMEYPTAIGLYLTERTKRFTPIYLGALGINVLLNALLVQRYGMFGAGWAWLIAWLVIVCMMAWIGQRYYALDYDWKMLLLPVVPWIGILTSQHTFVQQLAHLSWIVPLALTLALLLGVGLWLARDLRQTQKEIALQEVSL